MPTRKKINLEKVKASPCHDLLKLRIPDSAGGVVPNQYQ
jgi:hypothetical protein